MKRRILVVALAVGFAVLQSAAAFAQIKPEIIKRGKRATALVVVPRRGFGTAFCIDKAGYFVTNHHVIGRGAKLGQSVTLVINAAEKDEKVIPAEVVRLDAKADLALLRVGGKKQKLTSLALGSVDKLVETQRLIAFGYPFGTRTKLREQNYPNVSVNLGRITSLRKNKGRLERIQLDAQLNTGNSGGPVLDEAGRVVGIVKSGFIRSGVNFAIPITQLDAFLTKPEITFHAPTVEYDKRHNEIVLPIGIVSFGRKSKKFDVALELKLPGGPSHTFAAETAAGKYRVKAVPVPKQAGQFKLPATVSFRNGSVRGLMADREIQLGKMRWKLSRVSQIERKNGSVTVTLRDYTQHKGKQLSLGEASMELGNTKVKVNLDHADSVVIYPSRRIKQVEYRITAKQGGKTLAIASGTISIRMPELVVRRTGKTPNGAITKPRWNREKITVDLNEPFHSYRIGASGRLLILYQKKARNLTIFDVFEGRVIKKLEFAADDLMFAAGRDKLFVILPGQMLLQRWSLTTFRRESSVSLAERPTPRILLVGSNSDGPLLLWGGGKVELFDIQTLKPIKIKEDVLGGNIHYGRNGFGCRVSAGGQVFAGWTIGRSSQRYNAMRLDGKTAEISPSSDNTSNAIRWAWPNANGSLFFAPMGKVYSVAMKPLSNSWLTGKSLLPTVDPRYFLATAYRPYDREGMKTGTVSFCTSHDRRVIYTLSDLDEMKGHKIGTTTDRRPRYQYLPRSNLLVTLPVANDRIVIRRFNLLERLKQSGTNYLFVSSMPPTRARRADAFSYQLRAHSKAGGLQYKLESAPEGMTISSTGEVRWNVPTQPESLKKVHVIVAVKDAAGKEVFHAFDVMLK